MTDDRKPAATRLVDRGVPQEAAEQQRVGHDRAGIANRRDAEAAEVAEKDERDVAVPSVARLAFLVHHVAGNVRVHVDESWDEELVRGVDHARAGGMRDGRRVADLRDRSEERRVGKECRSRWSPY